jgi:hypothetical protein
MGEVVGTCNVITCSFCLPGMCGEVRWERLSERTRTWFVIHLMDFKMSFHAKDYCTAQTVGAVLANRVASTGLMTEQTTTTKKDTDKRGQ